MGASVSSCSATMFVEETDDDSAKPKSSRHNSLNTATLWLRESNGTTTTYRGEVKRGKPHGHGSAQYANGDEYVGSWKHGIRCGTGKMTFAQSGAGYQGQFYNDTLHGPGDFFWADGQEYSGDFHSGQMHGYGIYSYGDYFYKGSYKKGVRVSGKGLWHDSKWEPVSSKVHKNDPGHRISEVTV